MDTDGLVTELVLANHILYRQDVLDGFGHVSVRHPSRPDRFLLSRSKAPKLIRADDILEYDLDSEPVRADSPPGYLERFIHSEIYRARPDVQSIVHSHARPLLAFGAVPSVPLRPICHMCGFIGASAPVFDMRDVAGDQSDLLVRDTGAAHALAGQLAEGNIVLMRGHGMTVVGASIREAVFRSIYAVVNARTQIEAIGLGEVTYLSLGEAKATDETARKTLDRAWELWRQEEG